MLAKVLSGATIGLKSVPVTVEVDISSQSLPSFTIVGLPSKSIEESKERVRSAIKNSGADFPPHRITVNLAPADLPKEGPSYDLPIALGILVASGQLHSDLSESLCFGELSLDGSLRHTNGILSLTLLAKEKKYKNVFLPEVNAREAAIVDKVTIYPVQSILTLFRHLNGSVLIKKYQHISFAKIKEKSYSEFDFSDIIGQELGKRVLEITASGGHNLHMKGVPGAGKTMLARALPGILPDLTEVESLEVTKIYSVTGNLPEGASIINIRPFRAPHHTTSRIGLIGGGTRPLPGEISLAHRGVLFLDEFPEYPRHVLEALRQPLEDGIVTISRAVGSVTYPARFVLVAASNPCPCGYLGHPVRSCKCLPGQINQYQKKVSSPIMDRIDLHIDLPPVKADKLTAKKSGDNSEIVQKEVQSARNIQTKRFHHTKFTCNADMTSKYIKENIRLSRDCLSLLSKAVDNLNLSARSYYRVIKVARSVADLDGEKEISANHIAEALQYRPRDDTIKY